MATYGGRLFKLMSCWVIENVAVIIVCEAMSYGVDQSLTGDMITGKTHSRQDCDDIHDPAIST